MPKHHGVPRATVTTLLLALSVGCQFHAGTGQLPERVVAAGLQAGLSLQLRGSGGVPLGDPLIQVGGHMVRAVGSSLVLTNGMLDDARTSDQGVLRIFARGYAPKVVPLDRAGSTIDLAPLHTVAAGVLASDGGSLHAPDAGLSVNVPGGVLRAGTSPVSLGTYAPDATAANGSFATAEAALQAKLASATGKNSPCVPEQPLPCAPPTIGLGLQLTVDGPVQGGKLSVGYDLNAMAASGDSTQVAAASRLKQTFAQIQASPDAATILATLERDDGVSYQDGQLEFVVDLGSAPITDGAVSLHVQSLAILGVDMEVTVVSATAGSLPDAALPAGGIPTQPGSTGVAAGQDGAGTAGNGTGAGPAGSNTGLVGSDGRGLLAADGALLISQDGAGLISQDGGGLISQDGGGLISQDGGGLISQDGGGLISQDGGGLIGQDGAGLMAASGSFTGTVRAPFAPEEAKYRLDAFTDYPWPGANVYGFVGTNGPVWFQADGSGRYTVPASGRALPYVFLIASAGPYGEATIAAAPHGNVVTADIDAATTAVSMWVLDKYVAHLATVSNFSPDGFARDVANMRTYMTQAQARLVVSSPLSGLLATITSIFTTNGLSFQSLVFPAGASGLAAPPTPAPAVSAASAASGVVGVAGGHFDLDLYTASTDTHKHAYDKTYNVTGDSLLAPKNSAFALSNAISSTATPFKVLVMNQALSPAVAITLGSGAAVPVTSLETAAGLSLASLPTFTRANIGTFAFNMPVDAFTAKDWSGTGTVQAGVLPTQTGCVHGAAPGTLGPAPHLLYRNGALVIQVVKDTTPDSAIQLADAAGDPRYGYRLKDAVRSQYVLAEWSIFWHNPNGLCTGSTGWTDAPPPSP